MPESSSRRLDAVVLAGAPNTGKLRAVSDVPNEALIPAAGKPLVRYPVEALLAARSVGRVVVVGPEAELGPALAGLEVELTPAGDTMLENALRGCRRLAESKGLAPDLVLICTSDVPLITPEVVDGLVQTCIERGGDLFYPILERSVLESRFPSTKRTYGTLRDGTFTGGNLFVVDWTVLEREAPTAEALIRSRKNPLQMARTLGFGFLLGLVLGRLSIDQLEAHVGRKFRVTARAVVVPWPEIGIDVDKPEDLELVERILTGG